MWSRSKYEYGASSPERKSASTLERSTWGNSVCGEKCTFWKSKIHHPVIPPRWCSSHPISFRVSPRYLLLWAQGDLKLSLMRKHTEQKKNVVSWWQLPGCFTPPPTTLWSWQTESVMRTTLPWIMYHGLQCSRSAAGILHGESDSNNFLFLTESNSSGTKCWRWVVPLHSHSFQSPKKRCVSVGSGGLFKRVGSRWDFTERFCEEKAFMSQLQGALAIWYGTSSHSELNFPTAGTSPWNQEPFSGTRHVLLQEPGCKFNLRAVFQSPKSPCSSYQLTSCWRVKA